MTSKTPIFNNNIDRFYSADPVVFAKKYIDYVSFVLKNIDTEEIRIFVKTLLDARSKNATIFFVGNGGSAATASHFANDLAIGCSGYKDSFRAISLNDNVPVLTAIGNDFGYDEIFVRQLRVHGKQGDVIVGISASGNSQNLINTFKYAKSVGIKTVALTAFDGGLMKSLADEGIHIPTELKEYGPAEDAHMVLDHLVSSYLMRYIKDA